MVAQKVPAGFLGVQGHPQLSGESEASLSSRSQRNKISRPLTACTQYAFLNEPDSTPEPHSNVVESNSSHLTSQLPTHTQCFCSKILYQARCVCNLSTLEADAGRSLEVPGQPDLHNKFQASYSETLSQNK